MMRKAMLRKITIVVGALIVASLAAFSQNGASQSAIEDDVILRAMRDEIDRSRQLRVVGGSDAAPYFISYRLEDTESFHVSASLGAAINANSNHFRSPLIELRVGNYDFDNSGHLYSGIYSGSRLDGAWPLDDRYPTLRECLWLGTDRAYKTAVESMARKRAALNSSNAPAEKIADFSQIEPVKNLAKVSHKKADTAAWQARVVKLSGVFNAYPEVLSSGVEFDTIQGTDYVVTNEGTVLRYPDDLTFLYVKAEGQAPDGMLVRDFAEAQAIEADQMPSDADLVKSFTEAAANVRALVNAPTGEAFSGPTLFEPQAAAQLMAQLLGDNLWMPRKPISEPGRTANFLPSELETKSGSRILPDWMDVSDDPTQTAWNGKPLVGSYSFDDEGVPAKSVSVVEKGVLKSLLTTRQPIRGSATSNGHARLPGAYGAHRAAISNLFVKAGETTPLADLKKKLIDMCKQRGKPYGMLVRKLDFPFSAGPAELRSLAAASAQSGGSARPVSPPLLVYRVYADGREELVRGLRFRGLSTRSMRDILGASQETALFDYVNNAAPLAMLGAGGYLAPAVVISPALLFDEIEFELPQDQLPKRPIVPPPTGS